MAKSLIYVVNTNLQPLVVGDTIGLGSTVRRFGCNIVQDGNTIILKGTGYYKIAATFTFASTAAGTATITMFNDGFAVPGAEVSATTSAVDNSRSMTIEAVVRVRCDRMDNSLSFVVTGEAGNMSNVAIVVEKV